MASEEKRLPPLMFNGGGRLKQTVSVNHPLTKANKVPISKKNVINSDTKLKTNIVPTSENLK